MEEMRGKVCRNHNLPDIPIDVNTLNEEAKQIYIEQLSKLAVNRIWLTGINNTMFEKDRGESIELMKNAVSFFTEKGYEVGIWIRAFGFGIPLPLRYRNISWTRLHSVWGNAGLYDAFCPEDLDFRNAYLSYVEDIANCGAGLIMLDDDLCQSVRPGLGCFCPKHRKIMAEKLGEAVEIEGLADKIFTGGSNRYRDAWMETSRETMENFANEVRECVHKVDASIRVGFCAGYTSWDIEGIDAISLTKILAGKNEPFLRLMGAPYWCNSMAPRFYGQKLNAVIECVREQAAWCREAGVEFFAENDTFPRPAYEVPGRLMEQFAYAMQADGIRSLKYLYDYFSSPEYETLYIRMHHRSKELYEAIDRAFEGTKDWGVRLYRPMRTIQNAALPETFIGEFWTMRLFFSGAAAMLTQLGIPVCYSGEAETGAAFGEDAKELLRVGLPKKLILDLPAVRILQEHGIDVGLRDWEKREIPELEYFHTPADKNQKISISYACLTVPAEISAGFGKATLDEMAVVESEFEYEDGNAPSSYRYSNGTTEFLVLLFDAALVGQSCSTERSYCRQRQMMSYIEGVFPAIAGHPDIYSIAKKTEDNRRKAVLFENLSEDPLFGHKIILDKKYKNFHIFGAKGTVSEDGKGIDIYTELAPGEAFVLEIFDGDE